MVRWTWPDARSRRSTEYSTFDSEHVLTEAARARARTTMQNYCWQIFFFRLEGDDADDDKNRVVQRPSWGWRIDHWIDLALGFLRLARGLALLLLSLSLLLIVVGCDLVWHWRGICQRWLSLYLREYGVRGGIAGETVLYTVCLGVFYFILFHFIYLFIIIIIIIIIILLLLLSLLSTMSME